MPKESTLPLTGVPLNEGLGIRPAGKDAPVMRNAQGTPD
jgi:hypothetical protein